MFTFEYTEGWKISKKTLLCEFAYILSTEIISLKQHGFPVKIMGSVRESEIMAKATGISTSLANSKGKTFHETMLILLDLLKTPNLSYVVIAEYDKFYSLIMMYGSTSPIYTQLIRELSKANIANFDMSELSKLTNIAICDCLSMYNKILK
jgi:hypothetical protein